MPQNAYCQECAARVTLGPTGECPNGHPRSSLRDVREGAAQAESAKRPAASSQPVGPPKTDFAPPTSLASEIIGKAIVVVPLALVAVIGLWTGYVGSRAEGFSPLMSWLAAIGSLALTGLLVVVLAMRRRRQR